MEQRVFQLTFSIEGTTEKVYKIIHLFCNFKWDKLLKHVIFYNDKMFLQFYNHKKFYTLTPPFLFFFGTFSLFNFSEEPSVGTC